MSRRLGAGDYRYVELSYAHLVIARRNIAEVLGDLVEAREASESQAREIGRRLLDDNPARLFEPGRLEPAPAFAELRGMEMNEAIARGSSNT